MNLSELRPVAGSRKTRKIVGRGPGSGMGKTSGKGHKGQKARSGGYVRPGFEGGQMPIQRRLPKRGFFNHFKKSFNIINVSRLCGIPNDTLVDPAYLFVNGFIDDLEKPVKVLGDGELDKVLKIKAHKISKSAQDKIEKAGGSVEVVVL